MKLYPFKVFCNDILRGEHLTRKGAEKMASQLLKTSKGRYTPDDLEVVDLTISAVLAARRRRSVTPQQLALI
jgi:anthranilate phosphoribosyltransferase